jgi:peroxiredoxin
VAVTGRPAAPRLLAPGDPAPRFAVPAVNREGDVTLADYHGRSAVLLGLFRGLHCPFCRRQIAQLGAARERLAAHGVEILAIVNTPLERARLYFRYRPTAVGLGADPDARTHAAFGLPEIGIVPDDASPAELHWPYRATMAQLLAARVNPTGEMPEPTNPIEANAVLNRRDGFELTDVDRAVFAAHGLQLAGHFLIDREGLIRWTHVEGQRRPDDIVSFPGVEDLVSAAALAGG